MSEILKGNFQIKQPITQEEESTKETIKDTLKKKVLASLGGSMVYVERGDLVWDGDDQFKRKG